MSSVFSGGHANITATEGHNLELATSMYLCHRDFSDQFTLCKSRHCFGRVKTLEIEEGRLIWSCKTL